MITAPSQYRIDCLYYSSVFSPSSFGICSFCPHIQGAPLSTLFKLKQLLYYSARRVIALNKTCAKSC